MTGTYIGDGTGFAIETPGFRPKTVAIMNMSTASIIVHTDKMADDTGYSVVAASAIVAAGGVTLNDDGFSVGNDGTCCTDGEQYQWICLA